MADGYARSTGKEGVCMVVPGPGMLNALSGLATSWACNSRVLFIAGQIPSKAIGKGQGMLHEIADQSGILRSLTKWHGIALKPSDIPGLVHEAFVQLRSGRPRPVALEVPQDVLQAAMDDISYFDAAPFAAGSVDTALTRQAAAILAQARFPVIYAGGGVGAGNAGGPLQTLAEKLQAPVVMTEGARGSLSNRHPLALFALGGRAVLPHADVVLVAGSRFLDGHGSPFHTAPNAKFIYLNIDEQAFEAPRKPGISLLGDVRAGLEAIAAALGALGSRPSRASDVAKVREWERVQTEAIRPQAEYVAVLRENIGDDETLVSELTQVGYFSNIAYEAFVPGTYLTPGFQGTLGYGFPTALGVSIGAPDKRTVSITGDGGFGWGLQDLATAAKYKLNLTIIVFVDGYFGNVRRIQRRTFGREIGDDLHNPDFALLAQAFGIRFDSVELSSGFIGRHGESKIDGRAVFD